LIQIVEEAQANIAGYIERRMFMLEKMEIFILS